MNTSIDIHSRGWTSSYIYPVQPAFLGCMPPGGPEAMVQQRRWGTGMLEVLFNKHSPLIGIFSQKLRFRQRLAYIHIFTWGLRSIPELAYCLLPAFCLLHNSALFPKVSRWLSLSHFNICFIRLLFKVFADKYFLKILIWNGILYETMEGIIISLLIWFYLYHK